MSASALRPTLLGAHRQQGFLRLWYRLSPTVSRATTPSRVIRSSGTRRKYNHSRRRDWHEHLWSTLRSSEIEVSCCLRQAPVAVKAEHVPVTVTIADVRSDIVEVRRQFGKPMSEWPSDPQLEPVATRNLRSDCPASFAALCQLDGIAKRGHRRPAGQADQRRPCPEMARPAFGGMGAERTKFTGCNCSAGQVTA